MSMDIIIVTILRLLVPLIILRFPLLGIFLSIHLDFADWNAIGMPASMSGKNYQIWDKILDTYFLTFAFYKTLSWKDILAKKIAVASYLFRLLGVILFVISGSGFWLLLFPNFFQSFFLFCLIYIRLSKNNYLFRSVFQTNIILLSILIPTLVLEYLIHVDGRLPWQYLNVISFSLWSFVFMIFPFTVLTVNIFRGMKLPDRAPD